VFGVSSWNSFWGTSAPDFMCCSESTLAAVTWMKLPGKWTIPLCFKERDKGCLLAVACSTLHAFTSTVNKRSRSAFPMESKWQWMAMTCSLQTLAATNVNLINDNSSPSNRPQTRGDKRWQHLKKKLSYSDVSPTKQMCSLHKFESYEF